MWMVGDVFLVDTYDSLVNMKTTAKIKNATPPYLHEMYNVTGAFTNPLSPIQPTIARMFNALVGALNDTHHLPKYIVVIPDMDILSTIDYYDHGVKELIEDNVRWLLKNMAKAVLRRYEDLHTKRPGSFLELPKFIWLKMLARPITDIIELKHVWSLKSKFNRVLDNFTSIEKYMDTMLLDNMEELAYFNQYGNLTGTGKNQFWIRLNTQFRKLDKDKVEDTITLNVVKTEVAVNATRESARSTRTTPPRGAHASTFKRCHNLSTPPCWRKPLKLHTPRDGNHDRHHRDDRTDRKHRR